MRRKPRKDSFKRLKVSTKQNWWIIKAYLLFFALISSFAALLLIDPHDVIQFSLTAFIANVTGFVLGLLGNEVQVLGRVIQSSGVNFKIITACTGITTTVIFLAAVLAYPCRIKAKMEGIALGIPAIFLINLIRVISLFYISLYLPNFADKAHLLIWQSLIIFAAILLWIFWVERFAHVSHE